MGKSPSSPCRPRDNSNLILRGERKYLSQAGCPIGFRPKPLNRGTVVSYSNNIGHLKAINRRAWMDCSRYLEHRKDHYGNGDRK